MTSMTGYTSITITRAPGAEGIEVHVDGNLQPHLVDAGLQEARKRIGTREETPLEAFLRENQIDIWITPNREGTEYRASLNACLRDTPNPWGLLSVQAWGRTPEDARRELARRISGGTLVLNSLMPTSRDLKVPVLEPVDIQN